MLQVSRFPWGEDPAGWLVRVGQAAEQAGFAGLALMDHLIQIPQVGRAWDPIPEPYVTLGLLAGRTDRLELGTLVSPVTWRAAGVLAKAVATLDVLSGGRAFLGLGAGWWGREHAGFGLAMPPVRDRMDALAVAAETIRALWAPGTKAYAGERVSLPETTCYPRPVGPVPLVIGGGGERRTLRVAAQWGDACNLRADEQLLPRKVAALRRHCTELGRRSGRGRDHRPRSPGDRRRPRRHRSAGRAAAGPDGRGGLHGPARGDAGRRRTSSATGGSPTSASAPYSCRFRISPARRMCCGWRR